MNTWLEKLNKLVEGNPGAQVIHMVSEEANNGEYSRMSCDEISVRLTQYIILNENDMIEDEEDVKENLANKICSDIPEAKEWSDENLDIEVDRRYEEFIKNNPWTKVIYINVG